MTEEEEEEESERRREPGAVCSHLSSRRLGFVSVDAVVRGLSSDCLTRRHGPLAALQDRRLPGPHLGPGHRRHLPGRRRERWVRSDRCEDIRSEIHLYTDPGSVLWTVSSDD